MVQVSLSLLADTVDDLVENNLSDELFEAFFAMTSQLKEAGKLYVVDKEDLATLPISLAEQDKIYMALKNFKGVMPEDDFDIFIQLRG